VLAAFQTLKFKIRWWRWFLSMPNDAKLEFQGIDLEQRDILRERWKNSEPKSCKNG
jgi:hypothetical protein